MRIEARQILGNQLAIFTQANTTGLIVNQPTAVQRVAAFKLKLRQRMELLNNHTFFTIGAFNARDLLAVFDNLDIGTLT